MGSVCSKICIEREKSVKFPSEIENTTSIKHKDIIDWEKQDYNKRKINRNDTVKSIFI